MMKRGFVIAAAIGVGLPAAAQEGGAVDLGTLVLESESNTTLVQEGYVAQSGRQATKVDTDVKLIPQNISVVTQDQIEDQAPRTLLETVGYSSGTTVSNFAFDTRYDAIYLRGFPAYYTGLFRDGLRQYNGPSAWFRNDPYSYEGVALLKGPSSSLYGVSGPGGLVNVVSKRPLEYTFREIKVTTGTDDRKEMAFDFSGPVDEEGRFKYRLTGLVRNSGTPLEGYPDDKVMIAPSFTYELTDRTTFTFLGEYTEATVGGTASYYNDGPGSVSRRYNGDPDYNDFDQTQWRVGYELAHELTDSVTLRQKLRYAEVEADLEYSGFYEVTDTPGFFRYWGHYLEDLEVFTVDNTAEFQLATGSVSHEVVVGLDYTEAIYDAYSTGTQYVSAAATDAMDPPYAGGQETEQWGIYLHDQVTRGPLKAFLSARYDWVETTSIAADRSETDTDDEAFSGRVALSYEFGNGVTPFANYATSFSPNIGRVYEDPAVDESSPAEPTLARQAEVGVKYRLPGTESLITASLFDIRQEDGVVLDASAGENRQVQQDMHSRGFEIEAQASYASGLNLTGSFTRTFVEIEEGAEGTEGNFLSSIPENQASVWAFYAPESGPLKGIGFGGGLRYVGESWGDDANTYRNDDRVFADLAASYDFGRHGFDGMQLQVNVKNVFDDTSQTCTADYCYRYEGRTATASLRYRF